MCLVVASSSRGNWKPKLLNISSFQFKFLADTLRKKWNVPLRICSVNVRIWSHILKKAFFEQWLIGIGTVDCSIFKYFSFLSQVLLLSTVFFPCEYFLSFSVPNLKKFSYQWVHMHLVAGRLQKCFNHRYIYLKIFLNFCPSVH